MTVIGTLDIRDWDNGCMLTIGAFLVNYTVDDSVRSQYVIDVPKVDSGIERYGYKVPVFFDSPSDPYQDYVLPSLVFKQTSIAPAFERQPYTGVVASGPSQDAEPIYHGGQIVAYTKRVLQLRADPYDISYDLEILGRLRHERNLILSHVIKIMRPPSFNFKVIDSIGDLRLYDTWDVSISDTSELADIADRTIGSTISFLVRAEIDTFDDVVYSVMVDPKIKVETNK